MLIRKQQKGHLKSIEPSGWLHDGAKNGANCSGGMTLNPDEQKGKSECCHLKVAKNFGMLS